MKKIFIFLLFSVQIVSAQLPQARGVWLSRDILEVGPELIEETCYKLARANFNRIFVDVYYLGSTIYPSDVLEEAGGPRQMSAFWGRDPLAETIEIAHRWNLEVIAWFEYGLMSYYSGQDTSDSGPVLSAHPDWEAIDHNGLHFQQNEWGAFHWMDPAHPQVKQFMENLFAEIAARYPELDGIETDRIRYPSADFSYSNISRQRYQQQTAGSDPLQIYPGHSEWSQWVSWRESQINQIAKRIYRAVKALQPDLLVSAAVAPAYMLLSGSKLQRWDVWSDSGYVDALEPMLYLNDSDFPNQFNLTRQMINPRVLFYSGIDFKNENSLIYQMNYAFSHQADGVTIWYYGDLNDSLLKTIREQVFREKARLPHQDMIVDEQSYKYFSASGSWQKQDVGFAGASLSSSDLTAQATFWAPVWLSGNYALFARWPALDELTDQACFEINLNGMTYKKILNQQQKKDEWVFLHEDSLNFGSAVQIKILNNGNGALAVDALRLLKQQPLKVIDFFTPDSEHLNLQFNQWIDQSEVPDSAHFNFNPPVKKLTVAFSGQDRASLILQSPFFHSGQFYQLLIHGLKDASGFPLNDVQLSFVFDWQTDVLLIDNQSATFITNGSWQQVEDSCAVNGNYLYVTAGSGNQYAQWWTSINKTGYYQIEAFVPCSAFELSNNAHYTVLHNFGVQSVTVDQQAAAGGWAELGTFFIKEGKTVSIKIDNLSEKGLIAADAVRLSRTFSPMDLPESKGRVAGDFVIGNNYPNPFNNQTVIPLYLSHRAEIQIEIFDVSGRRVLLLPKQSFAAGHHQLKVEATHLSSGLYFYVLRIKGQKQQQRMHVGKFVVLK